jgi:hypothetical protein
MEQKPNPSLPWLVKGPENVSNSFGAVSIDSLFCPAPAGQVCFASVFRIVQQCPVGACRMGVFTLSGTAFIDKSYFFLYCGL